MKIMCGIVGFWHNGRCDDSLIRSMAAELHHRGPDDEGYWRDENAGIQLGHRRLAIIDLTPAGHQPMRSVCGRYVIVYNGEVYNYLSIRRELTRLGCSFTGGSDTEVIVAAISQWGLVAALERFVGMFALALWDLETRKLYLARDRIGIKPLYFGWINRSFVFASELKPFLVFPGFVGEINREALALYLRHNCVSAPQAIYQGIEKLLPGHIAIVEKKGERIEKRPYWTATDVVLNGIENPFGGTEQEALEQLESLLLDAVSCRMIADVPLGAFLSGGIDSSTVVALMQAQSNRPTKTFSIGNTVETFDEAKDAALVAQHLGTEHTELYVTPGQALEIIPCLPEMYDEPFADSSQIPTFLVSRLARQDVTVALSGDGGDELFGGYNRHVWAPRIWNRIGGYPQFLRKGLSTAIGCLSPKSWDAFFQKINRLFPGRFDHRTIGYKMQKLAEVLSADSAAEMYKILTSHWRNPSALVLEGEEPTEMWSDSGSKMLMDDFAHYMMLKDLMTYLPDDILTKVDRASMGVSLEARVPILDHRVVEFAWRLPLDMKIRNGQGKWILRQVLDRYVPKELVDRPKSGFAIPIDSWLRGPLRDWAETLLDESKLRQEGFFNPKPIRKKWAEHLSGKRNWAYHLWNVLMFQAWLEMQRSDIL